MQTRPEFYVSLIYMLAAVSYTWLGLFAWRRRSAPFARTMFGLSIWSFACSMELFFPSPALKLLSSKVAFLGMMSIPVFLLFLSFEYIGKSHLLTLQTRLLIWVIPLLTLLLVWTNESHHLIWDMEAISETNGLKLLEVHYGLFFGVQFVFSFLLMIYACVLLIKEMIHRPGIYRIQICLVILGILAFLSGNLLFVYKINLIQNLNITPLLFLPVGFGLSWAVSGYHLPKILPLENLTVLKNMKDGIILVNPHNRVLYINPLIEELIGHQEKGVVGQLLNHISNEYGEVLASHLMNKGHQSEMTIGVGSQAQVFEVTVSSVSPRNTPKNPADSDVMIILHDITERKKAETMLSRLETMLSAISLAAEQFLKETTWEHHIPGVLEKIGQAANVSRVYIFMNYSDEKGVLYSSQRYEWAAPGITPQIDNQNLQPSRSGLWPLGGTALKREGYLRKSE
jgi:PAS domain S-box-containing protein